MLSSFLGQAAKLFDKRFLLTVWFPTLLFGGAWVMLVAWTVGIGEALNAWTELPALTQAWLSAAGLLGITLFAYLCDNLAYGLVRWYEGYWPESLSWLIRRCVRSARRRWQRLNERMDRALQKGQASRYNRLYARLYTAYPREEALLMPTRLGNVLRAAEEYSWLAYNLDAPTIWPRLVQVLPSEFASQLEGASMPLISMLFCATLSGVFAVTGGAWALFGGERWLLALAVLLGGIALSVACYESAAQRAGEYGTLIRAAFDLYRHKLLKEIGLNVPKSLAQERQLWAQLGDWWYTYDVPLEGLAGQEAPPAPSEPQPQEHLIYFTLGKPPTKKPR